MNLSVNCRVVITGLEKDNVYCPIFTYIVSIRAGRSYLVLCAPELGSRSCHLPAVPLATMFYQWFPRLSLSAGPLPLKTSPQSLICTQTSISSYTLPNPNDQLYFLTILCFSPSSTLRITALH